MLAARPYDFDSGRWSLKKIDQPARTRLGPRMSSTYDTSISSHPDWQGQYPYLPGDESAAYSQSFDGSHNQTTAGRSPRTAEAKGLTIVDAASKASPGSPNSESNRLERRIDSDIEANVTGVPLGLPDDGLYTMKRPDAHRDEGNVVVNTPALSMGSTHLSSAASSAGQHTDNQPATETGEARVDAPREEDEDILEDEDMLDIEGELPSRPMTAAERTAARRKMKRFRLTHQQTRFLMSEFAKQPHPDAAHRERLSKEIPGLSPRQVQVWFQNRRAKIKRLTTDDRNQMIKMRAVPDDFDNVQALHSPYGAVHGLGAPMGPPVDFSNPTYGNDNYMRPLMVDVRRPDIDDNMSPTGIPSPFGGIAFAGQSSALTGSELMSPMTPSSGADRYPFGNQVVGPLSAGARAPGPLSGRQNNSDGATHLNRQNMRPLQPLHLRDPLHRSRSDSIQSPLRTSMSWRGDSLGYSTFPTPHSASDFTGRHNSLYEPSHLPQDTHASQSQFDASNGSYTPNPSAYEQASGPSLTAHPGLGYPLTHQSHASHNPRLRAASASMPLSLDIKNVTRASDTVSQSANGLQRPRAPSATSQIDSPSIYTTSYPPAPLTAPLEFSVSKSSAARGSPQDFSAAQLSAPISAPSDFSGAFQTSMPSQASRTPMRDSFGGGRPLQFSHGGDKSGTYPHDGQDAHRLRKRSFAVSEEHAAEPSESQS